MCECGTEFGVQPKVASLGTAVLALHISSFFQADALGDILTNIACLSSLT